ncbi:FecR family protein [bacterium]|nr:FecR family protein [bacterium]
MKHGSLFTLLILAALITPVAAHTLVVYEVTGVAERVDVEPTLRLSLRDELPEGAVVQTGSHSGLVLRRVDGSVLRLDSNTRLRIDRLGELGYPLRGEFSVIMGIVGAAVQRVTADHPFIVNTPSTSAAVRGTRFVSGIDEGGKEILCTTEGAVDASLPGADEAVSVEKGDGVWLDPESGEVDARPMTDAEFNRYNALSAPAGSTVEEKPRMFRDSWPVW